MSWRFYEPVYLIRLILGHFFPRKENLYHDYVRIQSIRYQKGKLNVIKRQETSLVRSVGFADWFKKFERYSKFAVKTVLKINWSVKTPWHERMEVARSGLWAPDQPRNYCVPELYSSFDQ